MKMNQDIRWHQRFSNYKRALLKLNRAIDIIRENRADNEEPSIEDLEDTKDIDEILKEGLVQRFEYTYELAWNVMKDYAEYQGNNAISGSRDATREAFKMGLITKAEDWMDMLASRKLTTHTYNSEVVEEIYKKIVNTYHRLFLDFEYKMESLRSGEQLDAFIKDE